MSLTGLPEASFTSNPRKAVRPSQEKKMSLATAVEFPRLYPAVELVRYRPAADVSRVAFPPSPVGTKRPSLLAEILVTVLFTGVGVASWAVASAMERGRDPHIG